MPVADPVHSPSPCDSTAATYAGCAFESTLSQQSNAIQLCLASRPGAYFFVNGMRRPWYEMYCGYDCVPGGQANECYLSRASVVGFSPDESRILTWIAYREGLKSIGMKPGDTAYTFEQQDAQIRIGDMAENISDEARRDPLHVFTQRFVGENWLPARYACFAQWYMSLSSSDKGYISTDMRNGNPAWADWFTSYIRPILMPWILQDMAYVSVQSLVNERESLGRGPDGRYINGAVGAPPEKRVPPPWINSVWPLLNAANGALATIPQVLGLPAPVPPCTPFPECVAKKYGIDINKLWDIVEWVAKNVPGIVLVRDRNGMRYPSTPKSFVGGSLTGEQMKQIDEEMAKTAGVSDPTATGPSAGTLIAIGGGIAAALAALYLLLSDTTDASPAPAASDKE